jgi:hypothetical protein
MDSLVAQQSPPQAPPGGSALHAEDIVRALDDEVVRALGLLDGAPRGIPELAIAAFDFGTRLVLSGYKLISVATREDGTLNVTITPLGREVIRLSAQRMPPPPSIELAKALKQAGGLLSLADAGTIRTVRA